MHNPQIEGHILGAIFFDPENAAQIVDSLSVRDFSDPNFREIFATVAEFCAQGKPIDAALVQNRLGKKIQSAIFQQILGSDPTTASVNAHIAALHDLTTLRDLRALASFIAQKTASNADTDEILDDVEKKIFEISTQNTSSDFRPGKEILLNVIDKIRRQKLEGNLTITGIPTGFRRLDHTISGLNDGDLIVLGARPGMGKTALALNIAQNVLNAGRGVAIFSLEMPGEQLLQRMVSSKGKIPLQNVRNGDLDNAQMGLLTEVIDEISGSTLFIDDGGSLNIQQLRSKLRKLKTKTPEVGLAIIDYLQLMRGSNRERHLEISEISRGLKILARELKIPIIALSQLNRNVEAREDKRPMLSDLRESGSIEQDADIILLLHSDEIYRQKAEKKSKNPDPEPPKHWLSTQLIVAKNRNGETRDVFLQFVKKYTLFEEKISDFEEKILGAETQVFSIDDF